jgi:hypothetical protein
MVANTNINRLLILPIINSKTEEARGLSERSDEVMTDEI